MTTRKRFSQAKGLPSRGCAPAVDLGSDDGVSRLSISGCWTVREAARLEQTLSRLSLPSAGDGTKRCEIDLSSLEHLDTAGAWLLNKTADVWGRMGVTPQFVGVTEPHAILLDEVREHRVQVVAPSISAPPPSNIIADLGRGATHVGAFTYALVGLLGAVTTTILNTLFRPWRFRGTAFLHHLEHAGLRAIPIISLICVLIGAVVMQQGALQLAYYGAESYAVQLVSVLSLREVGVLLTSIMVAGRSGAAFTAEIGSMKMREEIDAMRTLGVNPLETLVVPRVLALLVALPLLTFVADIMCLVGGGIIAVTMLAMDPFDYILRLHDATEVRHFLVGMLKTPLAALSIALIGCLEGMKVRGSAESLGHHVTSAVVKSIFVVIILDAVFALFLSAMGI